MYVENFMGKMLFLLKDILKKVLYVLKIYLHHSLNEELKKNPHEKQNVIHNYSIKLIKLCKSTLYIILKF